MAAHYTTRPANAAEAEGRRLERFQVASPSLDLAAIPEDETNPIFPELSICGCAVRRPGTRTETPGVLVMTPISIKFPCVTGMPTTSYRPTASLLDPIGRTSSSPFATIGPEELGRRCIARGTAHPRERHHL